MTAGREALLVVTVCALVYLSAIGDRVPFFTRGEPREGLVAREMLRRGEWLVPARPDGEPTRKPPLYYWLAAATLRAVPAAPELALRLPSAALGTAAVLGTWATARATWGGPAGLPTALVLATAFEWMRAATSARVDMTLAAALTAVLAGWMLALGAVSPRRERAGRAVAAAGAALGALAKGPVAIVLAGLAAVALLLVRRQRAEWRRLRPLLVLTLAAAAAGLWYGAAVAREGTAVLDVVVRENLLRFVDTDAADTGHAHGPGYLPIVGLAGWLPWVPLLPLALTPLQSRPRSSATVFAAVWVVVGGVFFGLASSKRSVYLLPLYPALALLTGAGVAASPAGRPATLARAAAAAYGPVLAALAVVLGALALGVDVGRVVRPFLRPADVGGANAFAAAVAAARAPLTLLAVTSLALAPLVARAVRDGAWRRTVVAIAGLTVAWTWAFNVLVYPTIAGERSLRGFLQHVETLVPRDAPLYAMFPPDPGVRFYAPAPLVRWPDDSPAGGHLLLWEDEWRRLRDAAGRPLTVVAVSDVRQGSRGYLALTLAPPGRLRGAPADTSPARAPGLRTGSSPR
jgi:4-amino-4-deoxy-L-arabinose transferase-like glycosyltransferase